MDRIFDVAEPSEEWLEEQGQKLQRQIGGDPCQRKAAAQRVGRSVWGAAAEPAGAAAEPAGPAAEPGGSAEPGSGALSREWAWN